MPVDVQMYLTTLGALVLSVVWVLLVRWLK